MEIIYFFEIKSYFYKNIYFPFEKYGFFYKQNNNSQREIIFLISLILITTNMGGGGSKVKSDTQVRNEVLNEIKNQSKADCTAEAGDLEFIAVDGGQIRGIEFSQSCQASVESIADTMIQQLVGQEVTSKLKAESKGIFGAPSVVEGSTLQEQDIKNYIENTCGASADAKLGNITFRAENVVDGIPSTVEDISISQDLSANAQCVMNNLTDSIISQKGITEAEASSTGMEFPTLSPLIIIAIVAVVIFFLLMATMGPGTVFRFIGGLLSGGLLKNTLPTGVQTRSGAGIGITVVFYLVVIGATIAIVMGGNKEEFVGTPNKILHSQNKEPDHFDSLDYQIFAQ